MESLTVVASQAFAFKILHLFMFSEQMSRHTLTANGVSFFLFAAQQATKVHPSDRAGFSYSCGSLGV